MYTCPVCMQDIEIDFGLEDGDKFCCSHCYAKLCVCSESENGLSVVETDLTYEDDTLDMFEQELENDLNDYDEYLEYSEYNADDYKMKRKTKKYDDQYD